MGLGEDLEIMILEATHNFWIPINYPICGHVLFLNNHSKSVNF